MERRLWDGTSSMFSGKCHKLAKRRRPLVELWLSNLQRKTYYFQIREVERNLSQRSTNNSNRNDQPVRDSLPMYKYRSLFNDSATAKHVHLLIKPYLITFNHIKKFQLHQTEWALKATHSLLTHAVRPTSSAHYLIIQPKIMNILESSTVSAVSVGSWRKKKFCC